MATAHFRSRARVIDLLGRQQIADAPTAEGELFKNSLGAGASDVWINYTLPAENDGTKERSFVFCISETTDLECGKRMLLTNGLS